MNIAFPYSIDLRGFTSVAGKDAHIEQMIEQLLFTVPGERVMRPDFGCGLQRYVFAASPELGATLQFSVHESLQRWLGHLISVESVTVGFADATITANISYIRLDTSQRRHFRASH